MHFIFVTHCKNPQISLSSFSLCLFPIFFNSSYFSYHHYLHDFSNRNKILIRVRWFFPLSPTCYIYNSLFVPSFSLFFFKRSASVDWIIWVVSLWFDNIISFLFCLSQCYSFVLFPPSPPSIPFPIYLCVVLMFRLLGSPSYCSFHVSQLNQSPIILHWLKDNKLLT